MMLARYLIIGAASLAIGFTAGATAMGWRKDAQISAMEKRNAEAVAFAYQKAETLSKRIAEADSAHLKTLKEKDNEISRLADDVAAGVKRLRVKATCPALPRTATGSGMGDAASPRLTKDAERHYIAHRRGIEQVTAQLSACQEILRGERKTH
jgi:hypothetical protein